MTIRTDNSSTIDKPSGVASEFRPAPLTEPELDHVAAAGSKPSVASGTGAALHRE